MTTHKKLQLLVLEFARFNETLKTYEGTLNQEALLKLDEGLCLLLDNLLIKGGTSKENMRKNYLELSMLFHNDKRPNWTPEVQWLDQQLSEGPADGICFKTLCDRYEKLTEPEKFINTQPNDANTTDNLRARVEQLRANSRTYSGRYLFYSLSKLLDQKDGYFDEVGKIKPKGIRFILRLLPFAFGGYGACLVGTELFTAYATFFVLLKGSNFLEQRDSEELKLIGHTIGEMTVMTASVTTALLARSMEMVFWTSRQSYQKSLMIGSVLLYPLISNTNASSSRPSASASQSSSSSSSSHSSTTNKEEPKSSTGKQGFWKTPATPMAQSSTSSSQASPNEQEGQLGRGSSFSDQLKMVSTNREEGIKFQNPELKMIVAPLEAYKNFNNLQFVKGFRLGWNKGLAVDAFLLNMRSLDKYPQSLDRKLTMAQLELNKLKEDKKVYTKGSNTAAAVDNAESVINLLLETNKDDSESLQVVVYNSPN
ncbi:MAG: hypothetical protein ACHP6H_01255 [Legionellales bacterium]